MSGARCTFVCDIPEDAHQTEEHPFTRSVGERERALEEALTWALAIVDQYDHHLRRGMYRGGFTRQYIDRKEEALAALAHQQPTGGQE